MTGSKGPRILIADDNNDMRYILRHFLEKKNLDVTEVRDGRQAIELLDQEPFAIATLDLLMPLNDGFTVVKHVRESNGPNCDIPLVIVSSMSQTHNMERAMDLGATDFVIKPFAPEEFFDRIHHLLFVPVRTRCH